MEELFARIEQGCLKFPNRYLFREPATKNAIAALEKKLKLCLPASYKEFLLHFNGGFICDEDVGDDLSIEDAAWNSNFLHGLNDIESAFTRKSGRWRQRGNGTLYIPFCSTSDQETLVFYNPLNEEAESSVIDAWHEAPPDEWEAIYDTFGDLFMEYVEREGKINTIG